MAEDAPGYAWLDSDPHRSCLHFTPAQADVFRKADPFDYAEGTHPGGSVVDAKRGKAYHFLHRGKSYDTYSSVYLIERTLISERFTRLLPRSELEDDG